MATSAIPEKTSELSSSLAEVFGDYGQSESNTMALVRKFVPEDDAPRAKKIAIPNKLAAEIGKVMDSMLSRPILDFLTRYFVTQVNWIDELLYPPWFLGQYQRWWSLDRLSSIADVEFSILFLRAYCYASHFLPSPTHTIDGIKGVSLADIRKSCEESINSLVPICARLDPQGSLIRVQHTAFAGLASTCLGQLNAAWESLSSATRVAQQISLHLDAIIWPSGIDELEKEMSRRTFCFLYIWDSCLSKRLDRIPLFSKSLSPEILPRMHLPTEIDIGADAPDVSTERIVLRARLAQVMRNCGSDKCSEYSAIAAEERYENFCSTFLQTMPPSFALQPDKQWDKHLPTLPMQRQLLHLAIFETLCWNFKPVLFQKPEQVRQLPEYKQVLTTLSKRALAAAALKLLEGASALHVMMGGSHTRYSGIIVPIFEAAVPLLCLCADKNFPGEVANGRSQTVKTDPLGVGISNVTRAECMYAARDALNSLRTLAEVSQMAETGARTLARLIAVVDGSPPLVAPVFGESVEMAEVVMQKPSDAIQTSDTSSDGQIPEYVMGDATGDSRTDLSFGNAISTEVGIPNWDEVLFNLPESFGPEDFGILDAGQILPPT